MGPENPFHKVHIVYLSLTEYNKKAGAFGAFGAFEFGAVTAPGLLKLRKLLLLCRFNCEGPSS